MEELASALQNASTPLLLAAGALLALTSVRNAHLSDRARQNVDECLHKLPKSALSAKARRARYENIPIPKQEVRSQIFHQQRRFRVSRACARTRRRADSDLVISGPQTSIAATLAALCRISGAWRDRLLCRRPCHAHD